MPKQTNKQKNTLASLNLEARQICVSKTNRGKRPRSWFLLPSLDFPKRPDPSTEPFHTNPRWPSSQLLFGVFPQSAWDAGGPEEDAITVLDCGARGDV